MYSQAAKNHSTFMKASGKRGSAEILSPQLNCRCLQGGNHILDIFKIPTVCTKVLCTEEIFVVVFKFFFFGHTATRHAGS